jgi:hypothetical protein
VVGGGLIALFYLPAGRISYDITAPEDLESAVPDGCGR